VHLTTYAFSYKKKKKKLLMPFIYYLFPFRHDVTCELKNKISRAEGGVEWGSNAPLKGSNPKFFVTQVKKNSGCFGCPPSTKHQGQYQTSGANDSSGADIS
jgi:hypothetical protein